MNPHESATSQETLREHVQRLVSQALSDGHAHPDALKGLNEALFADVKSRLAARGEETEAVMRSAAADAMHGLDEAAAQAVYRLRLALDEAWASGRAAAQADMDDMRESLDGLEKDLLGLLKAQAEQSHAALKASLYTLHEHLTRDGTDTGRQAREVLETLHNRLGAAGGGALDDIRAEARTVKSRLRATVSGVLRGLADALDARQN